MPAPSPINELSNGSRPGIGCRGATASCRASRLDRRPELRLRNVDLCALTHEAAADLRGQQPERPVTVAADRVLPVHADESGSLQVPGNLVGNVHVHARPPP